MRTRAFVTLSILLLGVCGTGAHETAVSGQSGVYAVVEKVVIEPSSGVPQRIQVWGAFALMERSGDRFTTYVYRKPERGYMYFRISAVSMQDIENTRREWSDLESVAGKKQAVAFGYWDNYRGDRNPTVRKADVKPENPDDYRTEIGLIRLNTGVPGVEALLKLLETR
jgi:hypothetical protein